MSGFKPAAFVLPLFICALSASSEGRYNVLFLRNCNQYSLGSHFETMKLWLVFGLYSLWRLTENHG